MAAIVGPARATWQSGFVLPAPEGPAVRFWPGGPVALSVRDMTALSRLGASIMVIAWLVAGTGPAPARAADLAAIDAHVRASMTEWGVPGLAYAVVEGGEVVHLAAFGQAGPDGRPMTQTTPTVIGSVGKSLTALAVRQLAEAKNRAPAKRDGPSAAKINLLPLGLG